MKLSLSRLIALAAALAVIMAVAGCKDDGPGSKLFVKDGAGGGPRIAVLPFDAVGNVRSQDAGRVVTSTVITYLLSTGDFDVVDPGALDEALVTNQIRFTEGLRKADLDTLQKALNIDGIIYGLVEEYGDVRVGNDSYPSISFSARLINARTGGIVWAGTISKTGADKVKVFDIGRISSMGKLCKSAVQDMATSLARTSGKLIIALAAPQSAPASQTAAQAPSGASVADHGMTLPGPVETPPATPAVAVAPPAAAPAAATMGGKSTDESKAYGENELKALLPDVPGFTKKDFDYKKHFHDTIEGRYDLNNSKQFVEVKLVDYLKAATSEKFVQMYHPGEDPVKIGGTGAFVTVKTDFGYELVDLAVGRFGLFVKGPSAKKDDVERFATTFAAAIK